MIRSPKRSDVALAFALFAACACSKGAEPLRFPTATTLEDEPRRPAGVAVDPAPELPKAAPGGSAEAGLVVLSTPLDTESARQVVRAFFRATVEQDIERLEKLMDEQAYVQAGTAMGRQQAQPFWRLRLSRLDYGTLAGHMLYREAEMEVYRGEDIARLRPARTLGMAVQGDDVLVRVVIATPRSGRTRLFGDEIAFLLRPSGSAYKIVEMVEDFQLP